MRVLARAFALMGRERDGQAPAGDNNTAAILLLTAAILGFTLMDATATFLTRHYHPFQVIWVRFSGTLLIFVMVFRARVFGLLKTKQPMIQIGRGLTQLISVGLFFTSLQFIGLAEATAIMDMNPVLITLGAALFLGEKIGLRRIFGIAAAIIGAMIIIRPGSGVFQPASLLPLVGAFTYAAGALLTRMARKDSVATSVMWTATFGTVVSSLWVPFIWEPIDLSHLWVFGLLIFFGTASQWLLVRAFSTGEAAVLAPFGYTGLVWAGLWGLLFFGQFPDRWTILGAAIVVAAGLYVWWREYRATQGER